MTDTITRLRDISEELSEIANGLELELMSEEASRYDTEELWRGARKFLEKPLEKSEAERIRYFTGVSCRDGCTKAEALRMINACLSDEQASRLRQKNDDEIVEGLCNIIDDLRCQLEEYEAVNNAR